MAKPFVVTPDRVPQLLSTSSASTSLFSPRALRPAVTRYSCKWDQKAAARRRTATLGTNPST
jgi:hypothetical protein